MKHTFDTLLQDYSKKFSSKDVKGIISTLENEWGTFFSSCQDSSFEEYEKKINKNLISNRHIQNYIPFISLSLSWKFHQLSLSTPDNIIIQIILKAYNAVLLLIQSDTYFPQLNILFIYICNQMRRFAIQADLAIGDKEEEIIDGSGDNDGGNGQGSNHPFQDIIIQALRGSIGGVKNERKVSFVAILYSLIKIMLRLCNYQQAGAIIKQINDIRFDEMDIPIGLLVGVSFYIGKVYMLSDNYVDAEYHLARALRLAHPSANKCIKSILEILIPVRLKLSKAVPLQVLKKHNLDHFITITKAIRDGNVKLFDETISAREVRSRLLKTGSLLTLEKCRYVIYRKLCSFTAEYYKEYLQRIGSNAPSHIIPISLFTKCLKNQSKYAEYFDDDDTVMILSSLKQSNNFKGYVSLEKMKVVLSKDDPFPQR